MNPSNDVYIVSAARTPMGCFQGQLASMTAVQLGSVAIKGALERASISPDCIDEVIFGHVLTAGAGQAPARQAALGAGIAASCPATTVNKVCASGMKATMFGAQSIMTGQSNLVVVGGMESMSNCPYYLTKARDGFRMGHQEVTDGLIKDGLWEVYNDMHMGMCAEMCAEKYGLSRDAQDNYAIMSYNRAKEAQASGSVDPEIVPVVIPGKRGKPDTTVVTDEEPNKADLTRLGSLRPAFKSDGSVTAGNASPLSDGASALILASAKAVEEHKLHVIARIRGFADAAQSPEWFTMSPSLAIPKALSHAQVDASEVSFYEINEAFSAVALANAQVLGIDTAKVNVFGGAVGMGHPLGSSGSRILVTLLNVLKQKGGRIGCAGICNGGGGASAMVLELH